MKKVIKIFLWSTCIILFVCIVVMLICNQIVVNNAEGKVFSDIDSIKYNKVGLLLGTMNTGDRSVSHPSPDLTYLSHHCVALFFFRK